MPDTPLDAIRARAERDVPIWPDDPMSDRRVLLAHIDTLTAAVEGLPDFAFAEEMPDAPRYIDRAAVLAILRGEQE
jgi:hypothetical protein